MNSINWVQLEQFTIRKTTADKPQDSAPQPHALIGPVRQAILCARQFLFNAQQDDGQWVTLVGHDAAGASQLLLAREILESKDHDEQSTEGLVSTLVEQSLPQGGWTRLPGSTIDVSVSVLAYLALKIQGTDPTSPVMRAARSAILTAGGADQCNTTTRYWLALLGQISFEDCPTFPPERIFLSPRRDPTAGPGDLVTTAKVNAALSVLWAHRPVYKVEPKRGVRELFIDAPAYWPSPSAVETLHSKGRTGGWWQAVVDRVTRWLEYRGWVPLRRHALLQLEKRLLKPPQVTASAATDSGQNIWTQIALTTLGHRCEARELPAGPAPLSPLLPVAHDDRAIKSLSPGSINTRTADVLTALVESGLNPDDEVVFEATDTFLDHSSKVLENPEQVDATTLASLLTTLAVLKSGEQSHTNELPPHLSIHDEIDEPRSSCQWESPAGFDTAQALGARLANALVGCQNRDGSWIPITQFRSENDQSSNGVAATGAVVVALSHWGLAHNDPSIRQASMFLRQTQLANGSWHNTPEGPSIHATSLAMRGLLAAGTTAEHEAITAGVNWLLTQQTPAGGWGEFPLSNEPGSPKSTSAVQSVDALLALMATGEHSTNQVLRGIHFLLEQQQPDGSWHKLFFRPGSPATCGKACDLTATVNPLRALARWAVAFGQQADQDEPPRLQLVGAMPATDVNW